MAASPAAPDPASLEDIRRGVGAALASFLARQQVVLRGVGDDLEPIMAAIRDLLTAGKRLRPAFCYWGWRSAGGQDCPEILATAAALELLQACALVHDDVIDASDTRRGMPALHRRFESWHAEAGLSGSPERFGAGAAILVGDLLLTWANEMYGSGGLTPHVLYRGAPAWATLQTELAAGQFLDLLSQVNGSTSVADALRVITYKTARYTTERPLQLGATLAAAAAPAPLAPGVTGALARYGAPLGIAFQLRDDVLGVFGDPARTGKPVGGDITEGKRTVLMALARQRASPLQAATLDRHLGDRSLSEEAVAEIRTVLTDTGALAECESLIAAFRKEGVAALDGAPIAADARAALTALADIVTDRDELPGLAGPDCQDVRDGAVTPLADVLELQACAHKAGEQLAERMMAHAHPPAYVHPPPGRLLMPDQGQGLRYLNIDPSVSPCSPVRWWAPGELLASCGRSGSGGSQLWLVPTSGATPTALTASPPTAGDLGDSDAWQLPSGTYLQEAGACSYVYMAKPQHNGLTTPVAVPGVPSGESIIILGAQGDRLAIRNVPGAPQTCAHGPSLMWFAPGTNSVTPLLGGAVNGGYVKAAVLFGER